MYGAYTPFTFEMGEDDGAIELGICEGCWTFLWTRRFCLEALVGLGAALFEAFRVIAQYRRQFCLEVDLLEPLYISWRTLWYAR